MPENLVPNTLPKVGVIPLPNPEWNTSRVLDILHSPLSKCAYMGVE